MNKNFEWNRFCKVICKDFGNIWYQAGTSLLIITLLPIGAWLLWWAIPGAGSIAPEVRWGFIGMVIILASIVTPSRLYRVCNLTKEGIYFAMLPASKLEKYLSMVLFSVLVCPLMCLAGSIVLDYFLALLPFGPYEKWLWQTDYLAEFMDEYRVLVSGDFAYDDVERMRVFTEVFTLGKIVLYGVLCYLYNAAIFLFTNTIFKKHKVLQTILWVWLISFVVSLVCTPIMAQNSNWMGVILSDVDPVHSMNVAFWSTVAGTAVMAAVFFWWGGYRLKRMKY